jgi:hypothetical protein
MDNGIKSRKAIAFVHRGLAVYEDTIQPPKLGQFFHELYNTLTQPPKLEWQTC